MVLQPAWCSSRTAPYRSGIHRAAKSLCSVKHTAAPLVSAAVLSRCRRFPARRGLVLTAGADRGCPCRFRAPSRGPARMLHQGGPLIAGISRGNHNLRPCLPRMTAAHFVLFAFRPRRAVHLDRSASKHSHGYASAADRSTCFAQHALNSEPLIRNAGLIQADSAVFSAPACGCLPNKPGRTGRIARNARKTVVSWAPVAAAPSPWRWR